MALIKRSQIPPGARIELRWRETEVFNVHICEYLLLIPLRANDRRRTDDNHEDGMIRYKLGETTDRGPSTFKVSPLIETNGTITIPRADGQHALWDALHLGKIPVWATFEDHAMYVGQDKAVSEIAI